MNIQTEKGRRSPRLHKMGMRIAEKRQLLKMSQADLAKGLSEAGATTASQSFVARLERGQVLDPPEDTLKQLGQILDIPQTTLLADLVRDKYNIHEDLVFPLYRKPLRFTELAKWEKDKKHVDLWICLTAFVDDQKNEFREAVKEILERGGSVTFFLPKSLVEDFRAYRAGVLSDLGKDEDDLNLLGVPLERSQVVLLLGSYTIANPESSRGSGSETAGYITLTDEYGRFVVGLEMFETDIMRKIDTLRQLRTDEIARLKAVDQTERSKVTKIR
jgi:transcriptional regulator with XRE-family HTH domain